MKVATPARNRAVLFLLWAILYGSFTLFAPPLLDDADSVHAEVAREMLLRHDYVTLYANGIRYLEKAPLYYWAIALSFKVFGVSTAASRLPLAAACLLLALLLEGFARRVFASGNAGLYAGLIALSSFGLFIFSRINIPDLLVCCWLTLALFAFWRTEAEAKPSRSLCLLFALACALNVLTKGFIGVVFPVGIVGVYLFATRGWTGGIGRLRQFHLTASFGFFLAISVPWHVLAAMANPGHGHPGGLTYVNGHLSVPLPTDGNVHGWAWFYFVNEQVLRYLNLRVPRDYDTDPLWLFLALILVWLMPWSVWLPQSFVRALPLGVEDYRRRLFSRSLAPAERTNLLLILWAILPPAFFCFSTRQEYYVLPALPPMILLISATLAAPPLAVQARQRTAIFLLFCGIAAAIVSVFFLFHSQPPAPDTDLATLLTRNPGDYALSFGHFLDLNARALGMFRVCFYLILGSVTAGTLVHFLLVRRGRTHAAVLTLSAASFVFLYASWTALRIFSPTLTSAQLARAIEPQLQPQDLVVIHGEYEAGSTFGFYLRRNDLHLVEGRSSNLWYGSFFPDAPKIFETRESIAARWPGSQRIFLWQDPSDLDRSPLSLPGNVYIIAASGGKQIVSNQPNHTLR